ncbi:MAG TPA: GNAT family N-acetyltransferase [Pyrinomonadaceae bacterium]
MIRTATTDDADTLMQIALDSKRHWGYPEHWIKHWETDLTLTPDFIATNQVYVYEADNEIRGFYALCFSDKKCELEHLWVRPSFIGTGIGKELFLDAMERAAKLNVDEIELSADPNAAAFYKHMGAQQVGEVDSEIDGQTRKLPRMKIDV